MASKNGTQSGISASIEGKHLVVKVPLAPAGTMSATGKSELIASTKGNVECVIGGRIAKVGVNAYVKR